MSVLTSPRIGQDYQAMLRENRMEDYAAVLCRNGLAWFFEMRSPEIADHLIPLQTLPRADELPLRLLFLVETNNSPADTAKFDRFFQQFQERQDVEGVAAAVCAGVRSIFAKGSNLDGLTPWRERLDRLLAGPPSLADLPRAGLLASRIMIERIQRGDRQELLQTCQALIHAAEKTGSPSLKIYGAASQLYPLLWAGLTPEIDVLVMSIEPLHALPEVSPYCTAKFRIAMAFWHTVKGEAEAAEAMLDNLRGAPCFLRLPSFFQLTALNCLLCALAAQGKAAEVLTLMKTVLTLAAPMGNSLHSAHTHYCMAVALLQINEPRLALAHARASIDQGRFSGSPVPERAAALVESQALVDLGETNGAAAILSTWEERWQAAGMLVFVATALTELAMLAMRKGRLEAARQYYIQAASFFSAGNRPPLMHRSPQVREELEAALHSVPQSRIIYTTPKLAPVHIQSFGELRISVSGRQIFDRDWRGQATKGLLKILLSLGGKKISVDTVVDLLWPDADGISASQNLKMAVHRLKRVGMPRNEEPPAWIVVKHKSISLSTLCHVDSLAFETGLVSLECDGTDLDGLLSLLSLYRGDFLANDNSAPWIQQRREQLRRGFVAVALRLSDLAAGKKASEIAIPHLERAIDLAPLDEELYERLLTAYHDTGYCSKALLVFRRAKETLQRELGAKPGARLCALAAKASGDCD